ncbi:tail fibers protein [Salmonella phage SE1Kor]|uniref:Tail fibers protein n=1 Tax=Salmonella phage SE1Kor TaxID=2847282 RepID=A0A1W6JSC4_9CAUD|nr:tail fiber protein [Salmonella phage SE1 (in:Nonagvirus)]ARM70147.1 tail fibers protein [Salmonella phage SE1 (in:Nonagvirus)]
MTTTANHSGILYLRNKNAEGVQLSYSRIYNEILGGTAYATIQVTREGGDTNYYQFDESGNAINYNTIAIGRGIINSLGSNSLVIGDSDTGFKQGGEGVLQVFCNGRNVALFDHQNLHLNGLLTIWPVDNNANGIRVSGSRTGSGNALIGGQVSGGAFVDWRDRAAGLLVELPSDGAASNVFKAVRWGYDWVAGLDVVRFNTGACEAHFNVRGAIYSFNDAGYASCVQWVSTSDIRLEANLKEIKSAREKVKSIKGYTYFKRSNLYEDEHSIYSEEAGVIAQDVQTVLPEAVYKVSNSEYLGVSYGGVTALLVNAFNEMSDQVDKQQEEIETLKSEIADLKAVVAALLNKRRWKH